ncbi:MAG: N(4)-(beta-N-acetylglucosaminyl)-L-asparaginase [Planctomycetota bacterium]
MSTTNGVRSGTLNRRSFLATAALVAASGPAVHAASRVSRNQQPESPDRPGDEPREGPVAIASGNGRATVELACRLMAGGADPAVAAVDGVAIVEADPNDMTVGFGGLPNENGVVTLDAAVMHGPTHKAGAVAAIQGTMHPAAVALKVLQRTDHVLLVDEGATRFARMHGFPEQNLLTDKARTAWLRWKSGLSTSDDWLDDKQSDWNPDGTQTVPKTNGTIHCSCLAPDRSIGCCTTTSGLSYKIPGRVGDSPLIGAGLYCDDEVGSAGGTGRGESAIQNLAAFSVVQHMGRGMTPSDACLETLREVAQRSVKQARLRTEDGKPNFSLTLYAVRKDGAYGSATMNRPRGFAICDQNGPRIERSLILHPEA